MTGAWSDPRRRRPCAGRRRSRPGGRAAGATDARAAARPPASRPSGRTSGAELEALDLAGGRLRQLADELDPARILIGCDLVLDEGLQLVGEAGAAARGLLEHDERLGLHEPVSVLVADHGRLEH